MNMNAQNPEFVSQMRERMNISNLKSENTSNLSNRINCSDYKYSHYFNKTKFIDNIWIELNLILNFDK